MQRRDDVVMFLAGLVVEKRLLGSLFDSALRNRLTLRRPLYGKIEYVQRGSRIPVRERSNCAGRFFVDIELLPHDRPINEREHIFVRQGLENENASTREQRRNHFE